MFFIFSSIPDQYKTQEICDLVDSLYPSLVIYCLHICNSKMCNEAVDDSLGALKLLPNLFVTSKMIKNYYTVLYANDGLLFSDEDSGVVAFCCNEIGILSVNLNTINLDNNFDEDGPDIVNLVRLFVWHSKLKKRKALKKR